MHDLRERLAATPPTAKGAQAADRGKRSGGDSVAKVNRFHHCSKCKHALMQIGDKGTMRFVCSLRDPGECAEKYERGEGKYGGIYRETTITVLLDK